MPTKIRPVFRDQSELSGGNLKEEIEKGLQGSKYLIVICSPRSAQSPWVSKEVQYFIDNNRENYIIPFIIGGSPNAKNPEDECFPEGLRQLSGEKEILGININEMGRDAAAIKVIARMFGLHFDTLWQRHERVKRRKRFAVIAGVLAFALISIAVAGVMFDLKQQADTNAQIAQNETERANKERDRANAQTKVAEKERDNAQRANKSLEIANDSIKLQATQIAQAYQDLADSNRRLAEERDNVLKANWKMMENRARAVAEKANQLTDEGDAYLARLLCLEVLPKNLKTPEIPYVPEIEFAFRRACARNEFISNKKIREYIHSVTINSERGYAASCSSDEIQIFDIQTGECVRTIPRPSNSEDKWFSHVTLCPNTNHIAAALGGKIIIWNISTGEHIKTLENPNNLSYDEEDGSYDCISTIQALIYDPDGKWIIGGLSNGNIEIWDSHNFGLIKVIENGDQGIGALDCNKDGIIVASHELPTRNGDQKNKIVNVWDGYSGELRDFFTVEDGAYRINFDPNAQNCIIYDDINNRTVRIVYRNIITGNQVNAWSGDALSFEGNILSGNFLLIPDYYRNRHHCFYATSFNTIIFTDYLFFDGLATRKWKNFITMDIDDTYNNIVYSNDNKIILFDSRVDKSIYKKSVNVDKILDINEDGTRVICVKNDSIQFRNLKTNSYINVLKKEWWIERNIKISPDGNKVAIFCPTIGPQLIDFNTGQIIASLKFEGCYSGEIAISPNNQYLAVIMGDDENENLYKIIIWDIVKQNVIKSDTIEESDLIGSIAISSDPNLLIYDINREIKVYDISKKKIIRSMAGGFNINLPLLAISPNGRLLGVSQRNSYTFNEDNDEGNIKIWNLETGEYLESIYSNNKDVYTLKFSNDSKKIVAGLADETVRIWECKPLQELIDEIRKRFKNRKLSAEERRKYYLE